MTARITTPRRAQDHFCAGWRDLGWRQLVEPALLGALVQAFSSTVRRSEENPAH
jgi:hypothetical protein